jgi:hypothetical protein
MRRTLLSLVSFVVLLLVLEVFLRTTHAFNARVSFIEPDTLVGWRYTPDKAYWFNGENDHPIAGHINNLGFRDCDRTRTRPAGTFRVAILGDSFVEALQVEQDSTFCALAERALAQRWGAPVEVMNFGRSGMTQSEELLTLERDVLPCSPDLVVLLFVPHNDVRDVSVATADREKRPFFHVGPSGELDLDTSFRASRGYRVREWLNGVKQHSALVSLMAERYNVLRQGGRPWRAAAASARPRMTPELRLCTAAPDSAFAANYQLNKRLMKAMHDVCAAHGVDMMLMVAPLVYEDEVEAALRDIDPSFRPDFFEHDLEGFARRIGVGFVPLQAAFERRHRLTRERLRWAHWDYAGHRLVARELTAAIVSRRAAAAARR